MESPAENNDCVDCGHSEYDHIGWRSRYDTRTNCRIVRCECSKFTPKSQLVSSYKIMTPDDWQREYMTNYNSIVQVLRHIKPGTMMPVTKKP